VISPDDFERDWECVPLLDYEGVRRLLPQQHPFIFIDRVLELEPQRKIVCLKNVSGGEPYFAGHFPDIAVMPGSLIVEAIAQASILLFRMSDQAAVEKSAEDERVYLAGTSRSHFLHPVFPGDSLILTVEVEKLLANAAMVKGKAEVHRRLVATASLTFAAVPRDTLAARLMSSQGETEKA
jgi:3-hydroxyacyl-[acyl-carrier-protein] dehydratase